MPPLCPSGITNGTDYRIAICESALRGSVLKTDRQLCRPGATIDAVKKRPARLTRRKLAAVVRKAITSYYTEQEQLEIERAATLKGISMSSFVASAALAEARRLNQK